jgi:hypothetical protein
VVTENASESSDLPESILWMKKWKPRFATRHIRAEFDVWDHDGGTTYNWDVVMLIGVEDFPLYLDVDIPWTHLDLAAPYTDPESGEVSDAHTHFGNATLGFHGGGVVANVIGFWGGAWVGIPSAKAISRLDATTLAAAFGARNAVEGHRFFPDVIPVRWAFGIEGQPFPLIYLRSGLYTVLYIPNEDLSEVDNLTIPALFEQIHELEVLSPVGAGGGLRFQSFINVTAEANEEASGSAHSIEPFISYQPPYEGPYAFDLFARIGLLFPITQVRGFDTIGNNLTVRTQLGYRF